MAIPLVLKPKFTKLKNESPWYGKTYELIIQIVEVPLPSFVKEVPGFNSGLLKTIRLVFEQGSE